MTGNNGRDFRMTSKLEWLHSL